MQPFTIDWRDNTDSLVNLSFLLDTPAGKDGFIRIKDGHLIKPDGERFRIWGVNFIGASCFPSKEDASILANHLAASALTALDFTFSTRTGQPASLSKAGTIHVLWTFNNSTGWIISLPS